MFSIGEIELMIEALAARAARHETYGRSDPRNAGAHDRIAGEMRKLRTKLVQMKLYRKPPARIVKLQDSVEGVREMHQALKNVLGE